MHLNILPKGGIMKSMIAVVVNRNRPKQKQAKTKTSALEKPKLGPKHLFWPKHIVLAKQMFGPVNLFFVRHFFYSNWLRTVLTQQEHVRKRWSVVYFFGRKRCFVRIAKIEESQNRNILWLKNFGRNRTETVFGWPLDSRASLLFRDRLKGGPVPRFGELCCCCCCCLPGLSCNIHTT